MATADDVALALPLTPETHHLVGEAEIRAMKRSAVFVNVGRGATVDEPALVSALAEGRIKGAALDVFEEEPCPRRARSGDSRTCSCRPTRPITRAPGWWTRATCSCATSRSSAAASAS